jgi:hypothetical protein
MQEHTGCIEAAHTLIQKQLGAGFDVQGKAAFGMNLHFNYSSDYKKFGLKRALDARGPARDCPKKQINGFVVIRALVEGRY